MDLDGLVAALFFHTVVEHDIAERACHRDFLQHANEELAHADRIAMRIVQLQGSPNFNPASLTDRSHSEYDASHDLVDMIREDLVAERVAIASYSDVFRSLGDKDVTTRRLLEDLLAIEEEHADDLLDLLAGLVTTSSSRKAVTP